ncbi:Acetyltransferase 3 [Sodalis praecaptivus]|uniref:Acetyltransferase 3 n=1 Tax=Sodalis praecaptivus TaxID=1239307 RepID=W0HZK2_9GAMM|nr:acyltransferase family protein [Sodalis praecaptivus]AHF77598.1 Acetyltransferase 3 [Sodalis praecaptivus]
MAKGSAINYRPDIDGLRAIAVMSVLMYHAFPILFRSGYVGVDIFFVISGFLITSIIRKEILKGEFSLLSFYKKRVRRIYPALILTLLGVVFLSWFLLSTTEFATALKHVIFSSLFTENFLLWSEDSYFDKASIFKPTLHIWSLAIEEQFYIFWPLIIVMLVRKKIEVKGIVFFIVASFIINIYDIYNHPAAAYYSPLGRSWELMVGSLFSVLYTNRMKVSPGVKGKNNIALMGLGLVLVSIFLVPSQKYFPGFAAIPVVFGSALVILYGEGTIVSRILSLKSLVFIGLISYPLYLVHWPLMSFASIITGHASVKVNALCLMIAMMLAYLIYSKAEKPIARKELTVSYYLFSTMIVIPFLSFLLIGSNSRINEVNLPTENEWTFLKSNYNKFGLTEFNDNATGVYTLTPAGKESYYFLGDSHVANLAESLYGRVVGRENPPEIIIAAGGGCIPIPNVYTDDQRRTNCWNMRSAALETINSKEDIKNVVLGGAWYMYFYSRNDYFFQDKGEKYSINVPKGRDLAVTSMMATIKELTAKGKNVFFIKDAPYITDVFPGMHRVRLQPFVSYNSHEKLDFKLEREQSDFLALLAEKAKASGAKIIDIFDNVCAAGQCKLIDDGEYVYADAGHFNPSWLRKNQTVLADIRF